LARKVILLGRRPDERRTNPGDYGCSLVRRTEVDVQKAWWLRNVSEDHCGRNHSWENVDLEKPIEGSKSSLDESERNVVGIFWSRLIWHVDVEGFVVLRWYVCRPCGVP